MQLIHNSLAPDLLAIQLQQTGINHRLPVSFINFCDVEFCTSQRKPSLLGISKSISIDSVIALIITPKHEQREKNGDLSWGIILSETLFTKVHFFPV